MEYQIGDELRIIACLHGHRFDLNDKVTIIDVTPEDYYVKSGEEKWFVQDDEVELWE